MYFLYPNIKSSDVELDDGRGVKFFFENAHSVLPVNRGKKGGDVIIKHTYKKKLQR
jgi:hypothetical protein